ncbi:Hint domain-containing protein [Paracoccus seriniphilus]|uniref:Hint domain-containing protein n=2 Tax=Paracoccus seriniphilus TaxID=184748 RepID=A0A239Q2H5_9RHOB|nr:Hint domain-containing protein [Paracoccus seriniphilus]
MATFTSGTATEYAQQILGSGATINSVTQIGNGAQIRIFDDAADAVSQGVAPQNSGLIISTGNAYNFNDGDSTNDHLSDSLDSSGDAQLETTVGSGGSADAAGLVINFTANASGSFTVPFTFMTEEYPQYFNSGFSDAAAVYLDGVLVPISDQTGGYFNIDSTENGAYLSNGDTDDTLSYDSTDFNAIKTGVATLNVVEGQTYELKIVIADFGDSNYNSALMIGSDALFCFARGTLIETADGPRPVESLKPGDLVKTRDNGLKPVEWLGMTHVDAHRLADQPKLCPVRICAGALGQSADGESLPTRDLIVSPQHRVLVRSKIANRMADTPEVLVPAIRLTDLPGIEQYSPEQGVDYFHILFDRHEIVYSEGAQTESLYTGPEVLKSLSSEAREEISALFPELCDPENLAQPARPLFVAKKARKLVARHLHNKQPIYGDITL